MEPLDFEKGAMKPLDFWDLVQWNQSIFKYANVGTTRLKLIETSLLFNNHWVINHIPHDLLERRCYMTLGQYDPELIFGFTSQQMAMLASKLVSDRILDILTSIYINISTFKWVCPSIHVLQTWSMSAYWDFENRKSTKGSPLWKERKVLSPISFKLYVCNP